MTKLLELLNEYSKNIWYFNEEDLQWQTKAWILSKEFWWIKWLVDNDKIDISKTPWHYIYHYTDEDVVKEALMQLAIQDEPIDFLISILK